VLSSFRSSDRGVPQAPLPGQGPELCQALGLQQGAWPPHPGAPGLLRGTPAAALWSARRGLTLLTLLLKLCKGAGAGAGQGRGRGRGQGQSAEGV